MVFVDPKNLGYRPFFNRWVQERCKDEDDTQAENLRELFTQYVDSRASSSACAAARRLRTRRSSRSCR